MKKLAILGVVALLLMVGVVSAANGYLAGNAAIPRAYTDSRANFYLVDTNNPFAYDAKVTEWNIYASQSRPMGFMVYRRDGTSWSVVYDGSIDPQTPTADTVNTYTLMTPLEVHKGDFVGLWSGAQAGAVFFDKPDGEDWDRGDLTGSVLFTISGASPTAFSGSSDRVYSVNAVGSVIVAIDIKPGSDPNAINLGANGVIPVAVFGSEELDVTQIDFSTVTLEGAEVRVKGKSDNYGSFDDLNGDGYVDVVIQVYNDMTNTLEGTTAATLTGSLTDGTPIEGSDEIVIVPPK